VPAPCNHASGRFARLAKLVELVTGRPFDQDQEQRFSRYLDLLLVWNRVQRLTGHRSPQAVIQHLFEDSVLFQSRLPVGHVRMADIGAGAGIPGVPLRIIRPEVRLTLIESMRKRVSFLAGLKRELDLPDIEILEGRAEDLVKASGELEGAFDVVVSRAVSGLPVLIPTVMRYLKPGGQFITAGPPVGHVAEDRLKTAYAGIDAEYRRLDVPELGISRVFVMATKANTCADTIT